MGDHSKIEWTEATWNPVVGCTHVSEGCDHCYAARETSGRLRTQPAYAGLAVAGRFTGAVRLLPDRLGQPLRWRRPRLVFVNSMSDLFHQDVPDEFILRVFTVMRAAPQHDFQVLTKRPGRMASFMQRLAWATPTNGERGYQAYLGEPGSRPLPNVWLGTSVENQKWADVRVPKLLETPAAVRFLSCEPLLGPLDLGPWLRPWPGWCQTCGASLAPPDATSCRTCGLSDHDDGLATPRRFVRPDWIIAGGESGPKARPMHPAWARSLRDQCRQAEVAFFMKQQGAWRYVYEADSFAAEQAAKARGDLAFQEHPWRSLEVDGRFVDGPPTPTCATVSRYGGHNGDPDGWPEDLRVREMPKEAV